MKREIWREKAFFKLSDLLSHCPPAPGRGHVNGFSAGLKTQEEGGRESPQGQILWVSHWTVPQQAVSLLSLTSPGQRRPPAMLQRSEPAKTTSGLCGPQGVGRGSHSSVRSYRSIRRGWPSAEQSVLSSKYPWDGRDPRFHRVVPSPTASSTLHPPRLQPAQLRHCLPALGGSGSG